MPKTPCLGIRIALCCLVIASGAERVLADDPDRIAIVRSMYSKLPANILGIREPIKIVWADILFDGDPGTLFIRIVDADNKLFEACLDGRFS